MTAIIGAFLLGVVAGVGLVFAAYIGLSMDKYRGLPPPMD